MKGTIALLIAETFRTAILNPQFSDCLENFIAAKYHCFVKRTDGGAAIYKFDDKSTILSIHPDKHHNLDFIVV